MEAMALVGINYALDRKGGMSQQSRINMQEFFERSICASVWLNVQRTNTTKREMDFFKERRQSLFFQWGLTGRGVLSQQRDCMGKFTRIEDSPQNAVNNTNDVESSTMAPGGKKRKLDIYSNVFCHYYPETYKEV